mmetsp:Transcript_25066/g.70680  ORF Transcript_25066/g.70680 Transcript_25066/m.70680 type:complete len:160 (+) Transcript_25066:140-619(+)
MGNSCSAVLNDDAKQVQNHTIVEDSRASQAQISSRLLEAAQRSDVETARACLRQGAMVNMCDEHGWAPLHYFVSAGHTEICRMLLDSHGDANTVLPDLSTPLMLAAEEAHMPVVKLLLEEGAIATCKDEDGFTALSRCDPCVQEEFQRLVTALVPESTG